MVALAFAAGRAFLDFLAPAFFADFFFAVLRAGDRLAAALRRAFLAAFFFADFLATFFFFVTSLAFAADFAFLAPAFFRLRAFAIEILPTTSPACSQSNRIPRAEQSEFGAAARALDECNGAMLGRHTTRRPHDVGRTAR